jgi:hypothetical protein
MILKIKAFIYRFSNIFGLRIYLAQKEEDEFINSQKHDSEISRSCAIGLWQGLNGFTTVWTYKKPFHKAIIMKINHAFDFWSLK